MSRVPKLAFLLASLSTGVPAFGAEPAGVETAAKAIFRIGPLPVTNSMVTSWVVALVLIIAIRLAIRRPKLIPTRRRRSSRPWSRASSTSPRRSSARRSPSRPSRSSSAFSPSSSSRTGAASSPGVGTIYMVDHKTGEWMELIRPGNADLNGTLALSVVAFVGWFYFIMRYAGPALVLKDIFGNKADKKRHSRRHLLPAVPHLLRASASSRSSRSSSGRFPSRSGSSETSSAARASCTR